MKKALYLLSALFFLAGCSDDNEFAQLPEQGEHYLANTPEVVRASVVSSGESQSRAFADGQDILWHKGDAISFFGGDAHNCQYVFNGEDGTAKADFERKSANVNPNALNLYSHAVYPYSSSVSSSLDGDTHQLTVDFPAQQTYAVNTFGKGANVMVAAGASATDEELFFRNACGYLVINLYGKNVNVKSITLESLDENVMLSGQGTIAVKNGEEPIVTMSEGSSASNKVSLDCNNGDEGVTLGATADEATKFWFALPPVTMSKGMKIEVTDMSGVIFEMQTTNEVVIGRNEIQPMEALEFSFGTNPCQLLYTTHDGKKVVNDEKWGPFNATIKSHTYENGIGVITFDSPLTTIKKDAFKGTNISSVELPVKLKTIEANAFYGSSLKEVTIPGNVITIGTGAFQHCSSLDAITFLPHPGFEPLYIRSTASGESYVGPFSGSTLESIQINRRINYIAADDDTPLFYPDTPEQGLFSYIAPDDTEVTHTTSVTLGEQVYNIFPYMFGNQPIKSITIPNSVTKIERNAFKQNTQLESIAIAGSVDRIDEDAFDECSSLKSVTFEESPSNTTLKIGKQGYDANSLTATKDRGPFYDSPLATIVLRRELNLIDMEGDTFKSEDWTEGIFANRHYDDVEFVTVTLGGQVRTIYDYMFNWLRVGAIAIPSTVTSIGKYAFDGCSVLSEVVFEAGTEPLNIGYGGEGPFYNSPLAYIDVNRTLVLSEEYINALKNEISWSNGLFANEHYDDVPAVTVNLGHQVDAIYKFMFYGLKTRRIDIPKGIKTIEEGAFHSNTSLSGITIPNSVTSIEKDAFHGCEGLAAITFEPGTEKLKIGPSTDRGYNWGPFYDSKKLTTLNLYRELEPTYDIRLYREGLFSDIKALVKVDLDNTVKTISKFMFAGAGIEEIAFPADVTAIGEGAFHSNERLSSLTIPNTVTSIEKDAFHGCIGLKTLTFESGTTPLKIGPSTEGLKNYGPFFDSKNLTTLKLDRELVPTYEITYDRNGLFSEIPALKNVTLGSQVKTIFNRMFLESGITSLTIPANVTRIEDFAFDNCESLSSVIFEKGSEPLTIGFQPHTDQKGPFFDSPLTYIYLDRDLRPSNEYAKAMDEWDEGIFAYDFWNDDDITTKVSLQSGVKTIYPYMFSGVRMTGCWIPKEVGYIGDEAFDDCEQLEYLTMGSPNPPTLGEDVFDACDVLTQIVVPAGSISNYKNHSKWGSWGFTFLEWK